MGTHVFYRGAKSAFIICAFLFLLLILSIIISPHAAEAVGIINFGGKVISNVPCIEGALVTIGLPKPGAFLITAGSRIYKYKMPFMGANVLGVALPVGTCNGAPVTGTVLMMGTSLTVF